MSDNLVSWSYYDGTSLFSKKASPESLTKIFLKNPNDPAALDVAKTGKIALLNFGVKADDDPYFYISSVQGFTKKAKKYKELYYNMIEQYPDKHNIASKLNGKLKPYGDYVYINIEFLDNYVNPWRPDFFYNKFFIKKSDLTVDAIISLINYKPQAAFGGTITHYRNTEIPALLLDLKIEFPQLYQDLMAASPVAAEIGSKLTYKGKKAYVTTLLPGNVDLQRNSSTPETYFWNGSYLAADVTLYDKSKAKELIQPSKETSVIIVDDSIVTNKTIFVD